MQERLTRRLIPSSKHVPNNRTLRIKCRTILQHWGVIWSNLAIVAADQPATMKWTFTASQHELPNPSLYVSSFHITLFPDYYSASRIRIYSCNQTLPQLHPREVIDKFCMNQYLKSIPMKSSIPSTSEEARMRQEKIPTYYVYNYGNKVVNGVEIEDIVYTIHIPCLCPLGKEEYPILAFTFTLQIPSNVHLTNNTFFWDIFLDTINVICFNFQMSQFTVSDHSAYTKLIDDINRCIIQIDEYILSSSTTTTSLSTTSGFHQQKDPVVSPFVENIISNSVISYYSIIIVSDVKHLHNIYHLCRYMTYSRYYDNPHSSPTHPTILQYPNPFFRTMCVANYTNDMLFTLPFPYCVINIQTESVARSMTQSSVRYFLQRQNYFIQIASEKLKKARFVPTVRIPQVLQGVTPAGYLSEYATIIAQLMQTQHCDLIPHILFKVCDILAIRSRFIIHSLRHLQQSEIVDGLISPNTLFELRRLCQTNSEGLKIVLGVRKFSETDVVSMLIESLERLV